MGTGLPTFRRGDNWSDQDSHQWNRLVDEVRGGMVTSVGPGLRMTRVPPFGTSIGLEPKLAKKIEAASRSAEVAEFNVVSTGNEVLQCNKLVDGVPDTSTLTIIAKPWDFRRSSLNGKTVWGVNFSAWSFDSVTAQAGTVAESWTIQLPYVGTRIAAVRCGDVLNMTFNSEPVEWLDLNVGGKMWTFR